MAAIAAATERAGAPFAKQTGMDASAQNRLLREWSEIAGRDHPARAWIYWSDFLATTALTYAAAALFLLPPSWLTPPLQAMALVVGGLSLFRLGTFIHEIQHLRRGELRTFKVAWNLLYGIPFLMPSFMYTNHGDHHSLRRYGTPEDGEYLPLATDGARGLVVYFLEIPLLPLLAVFRFGVLVPLSLLRKSWRRRLLEEASSYGINLRYRRDVGDGELYGVNLWADLGGCAVVYGAGALLLSGVLAPEWLARVYFLATVALGLNWIRTLFAHRYLRGGEAGGRLDQLADSVTVSGGVLTELLFPVGLRYHSLHHLFPTIPYHDLAGVHRRLCAELPGDSPYRVTVFPNARAVWHTLRTDMRAARARVAS